MSVGLAHLKQCQCQNTQCDSIYECEGGAPVKISRQLVDVGLHATRAHVALFVTSIMTGEMLNTSSETEVPKRFHCQRQCAVKMP